MTDKPHDLGDYQSAVDAYVAAGYSREGAEAAIDQHCAIVASHKPPAPPLAVADPEPIIGDDADIEPEQESEQEQDESADLDEDAKEEEPV